MIFSTKRTAVLLGLSSDHIIHLAPLLLARLVPLAIAPLVQMPQPREEEDRAEVHESEIFEPEIVEPEIVEPENVEPDIVEPEVFQPEILGPEIFEPEVPEVEVVDTTDFGVNDIDWDEFEFSSSSSSSPSWGDIDDDLSSTPSDDSLFAPEVELPTAAEPQPYKRRVLFFGIENRRPDNNRVVVDRELYDSVVAEIAANPAPPRRFKVTGHYKAAEITPEQRGLAKAHSHKLKAAAELNSAVLKQMADDWKEERRKAEEAGEIFVKEEYVIRSKTRAPTSDVVAPSKLRSSWIPEDEESLEESDSDSDSDEAITPENTPIKRHIALWEDEDELEPIQQLTDFFAKQDLELVPPSPLLLTVPF